MKTSGSAATFHVSSLDDSLVYYTEVLGFSEHFRFGDYAGVKYEEIQIHLSGPGATNKRKTGEGGIYIFCDDVDSYYTEITARGAKTQGAPENFDYGLRDFVIEDPDGNLISIAQETKAS